MEEVVVEVMQANNAIELFQTMAIVNLNMGNLNLEVTSLKNKLATKEKEKIILISGIEQREGLLEGLQEQHKNLEEEQDRK